jgi:hypothetical protein
MSGRRNLDPTTYIYYSCDKIKMNDKDGPFGTYAREKRYMQAFGGEPRRKRPLGRNRRRCEDNNKKDILEIVWGGGLDFSGSE